MVEVPAAVPIAGVCSMAPRHILAELAEAYGRRSGQPVSVTPLGGVDVIRRLRAGERFDFVVVSSEAIDALAESGHVDRASRVDLARSPVAITVREGAPRPDIGDEAAVREAVLGARRIGYSTGPSGVHLERLFQRWGIADAIAPRLMQSPPGVPVATLIARGDVDLGFQQLSELVDVPGVAIVGPLPAAIQSRTLFCAAICSTSTRPEATRALLAFLASPEADSAKRRYGMEPASPAPPPATPCA
jgi:molybdate transport system substrate-binding protein